MKIKPLTPAIGSFFGAAVDMNCDGSIIVVGTKEASPPELWIFVNDGTDNWVETQSFSLGWYCKISSSGDTIITWNITDGVVVIERIDSSINIWTQTYIIGPVIPITENNRNSVILSSTGRRVAIAIRDSSSMCYIYDKQSFWVLSATIYPGFGINGSLSFGASLSFSDDGNTLVVGSSNSLSSGNEQNVQIFTNNNGQWIPKMNIVPIPLITGAYFGGSTSISGNGKTVIVGAPWSSGSENPPVIGGVFIYE